LKCPEHELAKSFASRLLQTFQLVITGTEGTMQRIEVPQ